MEPLHPDMVEALKRAHPGLSGADIDRVERLRIRRFSLDPDKDADLIRQLDADQERMIREIMPRYREVSQAYAAQQRAQHTQEVSAPAVDIRLK